MPIVAASRGFAIDLPAVTGINFEKVFISEVNAFRAAYPGLRLNSAREAFEAGTYALWMRYEWRKGLKAMEAEDERWRDPLPPAPGTRPAPAEVEGITSVQFYPPFLALLDAFIAEHAHLGFHTRRQVLEEGMRELFVKHGWVGQEAASTAAQKLTRLLGRLRARGGPGRRK